MTPNTTAPDCAVKPSAWLGDAKWVAVCKLEEIPSLGARVVRASQGDVAVFRTSSDEVFAVRDACPHKGGPLSQGMVHGNTVTCPLHSWKIELATGQAVAPDEGCTNHFETRIIDGLVEVKL